MSRRLHLLLIGFAAVALLAHAILYLEPFEDSFITYRYARNFALGNGLVYNPGERVEGFTSFGWTIILGLLAKLGLAPTLVGPGLSLALGALFVVLIGRRSPFAALLSALSSSLAYYAGTGMETTAFSCLLLGGVHLTLDDRPRRFVLGGVLLAISAMFRPEGLGYAIAIGAAVATFDRARAVRILGVFALLFLPWFAWRTSYFGYPFPNTYYAKATPSLNRFGAGLAHLESFLTLHGWWLTLVAIAVVAKRRGLDRWSRVGVAVIAATAVNVVFVGGDAFVFWRFMLPALPFAMGFMVDAVDCFARHRRAAVAAGALFAGLQVAVPFLPHYTLLEHDALTSWRRTRDLAELNANRFAVGRFLAQHFPPSTTVALNSAGVIPYESGLVTIDMLGLNDVHIAHRRMPRWEGAIGHQKHDARYVLSRSPDLVMPGIFALARRPPRPEEVRPYFAQWFDFLPGDRDLLDSPELRSHYDVAFAKVDEGKFLIFFQRKE